MREIRPQPGPQEQFLSCSADIVVYGGAAFGGKTFALLLEAARWTSKPEYGAVIFRRTSKQIEAEGGLWDTAADLYPGLNAEPIVGRHQWRFPSGAKVSMAHMQHEKDKFSWQGAQLPMIGLDELTHFTEGQFWYIVSRNRDPSGTVTPYIRATTNPDPDSWVAKFIAWWIDQDTGYAIPERSGVIRWFIRYRGDIIWADSKEELLADYPNSDPMSFTFIASSWKDNAIGMAADPSYMAKLGNLPKVEAERLKNGNWKVRAAAGDYFRESDFHVVGAGELPVNRIRIRWWDRAATEPSEANPEPDWTAGVLMSADPKTGMVYVEHVDRFRGRPGTVQQRIHGHAETDGKQTAVGFYRDPGQAGIAEADFLLRLVAGWQSVVVPETTNKETKASPYSAYTQGAGPGQGKVALVQGPWNDAFIREHENFPKGQFDDQVDSAAGAFNWLAERIGSAAKEYAYIGIPRTSAATAAGQVPRQVPVEHTRRVRTGKGLRAFFGRGGGML